MTNCRISTGEGALKQRGHYDIAVVGGGINGAGIARDAAGRGLKVLLVEQDDLAGHTSSASSKLIHGGLRYLEYGQLRLVREGLAEREVLLRIAPHLVRPLRFVLPHEPHLRPAWMIRAGLFLYDHLSRRRALPASCAIDLAHDPAGAGLQPRLRRAFAYYDAWVDDARLVIANARAAADAGAEVLTRTRCEEARRVSGRWMLRLSTPAGSVTASALVNATGAWVRSFAESTGAAGGVGRLKLVKGSHIVVPRPYQGDHAYILQNPDRRVVFVIPFTADLAAIGTTDVAMDSPATPPRASVEEIEYLCAAASSYCRSTITPDQVVHTWSGVRALFDNGAAALAAVTRDYELLLDSGDPPLLSVYGGKITTYRRLAEHALERLRPWFPQLAPPWTGARPLPGGGFADFDRLFEEYRSRYPDFDSEWLHGLLRRHGTEAASILGPSSTTADLGEKFSAGLYAREVDYLRGREWARSADDLLWRRTKEGLRLRPGEEERLAAYLAAGALP